MRLCLAFAFGIAAAFGTELPPASAVVGNEFPPHHCEKWESSRVDPREPNTHIKTNSHGCSYVSGLPNCNATPPRNIGNPQRHTWKLT